MYAILIPSTNMWCRVLITDPRCNMLHRAIRYNKKLLYY